MIYIILLYIPSEINDIEFLKIRIARHEDESTAVPLARRWVRYGMCVICTARGFRYGKN
jgi:hypothetical protein